MLFKVPEFRLISIEAQTGEDKWEGERKVDGEEAAH